MNKYGKMLGLVGLYTCIYIVVALLVGRFIQPFIPEKYGSQTFYLTVELIVLAILFGMTKARKMKISEQIKAKAISPKMMLIVLVIGIATALFTSSVLYMLKLPQLEIPFNAASILLFLVFHMENSIYKEVYYRGYIFNEMQGKIGLVLAILIQGAIYGLLFMGPNIAGIAYAYLGVILFTMVYLWSGSLWGSVIVQFSSTIGIFLLGQSEWGLINDYNVMVYLMLGFMMLVSGMIWLRIHIKDEAPITQKTENRLKGLALVSGTVVVVMLMNLLVGVVHDVLWNTLPGYEAFIQGNGNLIIAVYCGLSVGVMALVFKKMNKNVFEEWHIKKMTRKNTILITIIGLGIAFFTTSLTSLSFVRAAFPVFDQYMNAFMADMPTVWLQVLCIIAIPIVEEIIFRGIMYYPLRKRTGFVFAMTVSVMIYAVMQGNLLIGLYSILGSVVYTLCFELGDSLWGAVLVQEVSAILMMVIRRTAILSWFISLPDILLGMICIASAVGVIYAVIQLYRGYRNQKGKVEEVVQVAIV
ncbi:MAG: lysostaphin resistance A-like protein [Cellulosilyticaceae bacterium]